MAQKHCTGLPPREDNPDFNLRDWDLKASRICRQTTNSRRFSASNITSLREDTFRSFRSNITISSYASPPGYPLKGTDSLSLAMFHWSKLDCALQQIVFSFFNLIFLSDYFPSAEEINPSTYSFTTALKGTNVLFVSTLGCI